MLASCCLSSPRQTLVSSARADAAVRCPRSEETSSARATRAPAEPRHQCRGNNPLQLRSAPTTLQIPSILTSRDQDIVRANLSKLTGMLCVPLEKAFGLDALPVVLRLALARRRRQLQRSAQLFCFACAALQRWQMVVSATGRTSICQRDSLSLVLHRG